MRTITLAEITKMLADYNPRRIRSEFGIETN